MSYELRAILEYDAARQEINNIKKPLGEFLSDCKYADYSQENNCIKMMRAYAKWEKYSGNEFYPTYCDMPEPEHRAPCESCQKALAIFDELKPARKRFGIAKTRLSRIARDHRSSLVLSTE